MNEQGSVVSDGNNMELLLLFNGGTVCDDNFEAFEANIICRFDTSLYIYRTKKS